MNPELLSVHEYTGEGYLPLVDFGQWRVAFLRFEGGLLPQNIKEMQRHNETDEVFVLLRGRCILFLGEGDDVVTQVFAEDMAPLKIYNVKKGAWHTHTLSRDAMVLVVENRDTTYDNSPFCQLTKAQQEEIVRLARSLGLD